ncbi:ligand-binding sensor domain-containing protein [Chitinophaga skermanii]|uniref:ligand-binding sensor domain-containing protein n=1 Tax=Chitinophaga skermanii TaxID=331697 RepID=UPI0011E5B1C6|nr:sensor histidine kinase [Chitinophaga skermanii]
MLWLTVRVTAQERTYLFDSHSVNEGLSQGSVYSIMQDEQGFIWFATNDGISRFDGYVFNVYRSNPSFSTNGQRTPSKGKIYNKYGLDGTKYYDLFRDSRKQLLVSHNNGISLYDRYRDMFRLVYKDTTYANEMERNFSHKFYILGEDTASHSLWVWRPMKGIYVLDNTSFELKKIILYPPSIIAEKHYPNSVVKDDTRIWLNYVPGEMIAMDLKTAKLTTYCIPTIGDNPVIKTLGKDSLLICSAGHITVFDKKRNKYTDLPYKSIDPHKEQFSPSVIEYDNKGNAWIGGNDGILIYNINSNEVVKHIVSFNTFETYSYNVILTIFRDRSDNLWVGTDGDGIKKYAPAKKVFSLYRSPYLTHNMAKAIYKHDDGRMYVGTEEDGLDVYEKTGKFLKRISNKTRPGIFPSDYLHAICREDYEHLWLHFRGRIGLFNIENETYSDLTDKVLQLGLKQQFNHNPFVYKRANGDVYFNYGEYLLKFSAKGNTYSADVVHLFAGASLLSYFEDFLGNQYVGTRNGLFMKPNNDASWQRVSIPDVVEVYSVNKNAHNQLLLGTNRGLLVFDDKHQLIKHYNSFDYPNMANDFVYGVLLDDKDRVWVSHNKGISQINLASDEIITYDHQDGLQSNEFNKGAYFKSMDGELFFGGAKGVNGFYPRNFKNNNNVPRVIIKRLDVVEKPFKSDTAISLLKRVELPYNQNTIAIEFVPIEYTNPQKNHVQYKLEGVDEDWLQASNTRTARYTNLRPGTYTFKVKASNNDGIWDNNYTTLEITIRVPFWQTLWFRFLLLLLVLGIAYYFSALYLDYKLRTEKLKLEKEQAVDQERARISSDMHDDLGSGLSTIRLLSEIAKRKIKDPSQTNEIERISSAAGELVDKMSEIIWAMNSSNDSLANLIAYMRSFGADFLEHAHIQVHFLIPETIPNVKLSGGTRRNIYLAVKESLHNVVKHAQATEVTVEILVGKNLHITIHDNGKGFDPEKVRLFGNGLKNIQKRMQVVGGTAEITSQNGTIVNLDIPLI